VAAAIDTALDKLQSLFSTEFFLNSVPVIAFVALHGIVAYNVSASAREFIKTNFLAEQGAVPAIVTALFIIVLTYVLSTLTRTARVIMEGKYWPRFLANAFRKKYVAIVAQLESDQLRARRARRELHEQKDAWLAQLDGAIHAGTSQSTCNYTRSSWLNTLMNRVASNQEVRKDWMENIVRGLCTDFSVHNVQHPGEASQRLTDDRAEAEVLLYKAIERWDDERVRIANELHFEYAGTNIMPTRIGNLGLVPEYYAYSRYAMDFRIFSTVLQKVMQADTAFATLLGASRQKVDFLIALFWQTILFTAFWSAYLLLTVGDATLFLTIVVTGPLLAKIWYEIAVTNCRELSAVLRSGIDLHRLSVLKQLHMKMPATTEYERLAWEALGRHLRYVERDSLPLEPPV
jgi:hypothetical protein